MGKGSDVPRPNHLELKILSNEREWSITPDPKPSFRKRFPRLFTRLFDYHWWNTTIHEWQTDFLIAIKERSNYVPVILFRRYAAFAIVCSVGVAVSFTNYVRTSSYFEDVMSKIGFHSLEQPIFLSRSKKKEPERKSLALISLTGPSLAADPQARVETNVMDESELSPEHQMFFATALSANSARDPEEEGGVKIYTVQSGDTVSAIAARNGITINTILWANDLDNVDAIKPGDQIFILPVAGFNYVIKNGDTLDSIAQKYQADRERIIAYNSLPANGKLSVGDQIVIPDGVKEVPKPKSDITGLALRGYSSQSGTGSALDITPNFSRPREGKAGQGHSFPYGYCTWFVAQRRYVPWGGNAGAWLFNARAYGYRTGKTPTVGSIVVTTENRYYGHVAVVEKVTNDAITVSEMNYVGWAKKSTRQLARSNRAIKGYIY